MFVLVEMVDTVRIPPWQFERKLNDSIAEELNKKLANKVPHGPRGWREALARRAQHCPPAWCRPGHGHAKPWPWASRLSQNLVSSPECGNLYPTRMLEGIKRDSGFEKSPCNCAGLDSTLPNCFAVLGEHLPTLSRSSHL